VTGVRQKGASASGQNRRYVTHWTDDGLLIRKRTFCATASNDGTWPFLAVRRWNPSVAAQRRLATHSEPSTHSSGKVRS